MKNKTDDIVGMYAIIWDGDSKIKNRLFIYGKAPNNHFLVQAIRPLDGSLNVCKLVHFEDMIDWTFYPSIEIFQECLDDWYLNKINRYDLKIKNKGQNQNYSPDTYISDIRMSTALRNIIYSNIKDVVENVDPFRNGIKIGVFEGVSMAMVSNWRRMGEVAMAEFIHILNSHDVNLKQ